MKQHAFVFSFLLALTHSAWAAPTELNCPTTGLDKQLKDLSAVAEKIEDCPMSGAEIPALCTVLSEKIEESKESPNLYLYQTKILKSACVKESDSDEVVAEKVSRFWKKHEDKLVCDDVRFNVNNGGILKYAVYNDFLDFIKDSIKWKIDLNRIDPVDKKTVLDYVGEEKQKVKGTPLEKIMDRYYVLLSKAGAVHGKFYSGSKPLAK